MSGLHRCACDWNRYMLSSYPCNLFEEFICPVCNDVPVIGIGPCSLIMSAIVMSLCYVMSPAQISAHVIGIGPGCRAMPAMCLKCLYVPVCNDVPVMGIGPCCRAMPAICL